MHVQYFNNGTCFTIVRSCLLQLCMHSNEYTNNVFSNGFIFYIVTTFRFFYTNAPAITPPRVYYVNINSELVMRMLFMESSCLNGYFQAVA